MPETPVYESSPEPEAPKMENSPSNVASWFQKEKHLKNKNYQIIAPLTHKQGVKDLVEGSDDKDIHDAGHMAKGIDQVTTMANLKGLTLKSKRNIKGSLRSVANVLGDSDGKQLLERELNDGAFSGWGEIPKVEKAKAEEHKQAIKEGRETATWLKMNYKNHPDLTELGPISWMWGIKDVVEGSDGQTLHDRTSMATGIAYIRNKFGARNRRTKVSLLAALESLSGVLRESEGKTLLVKELKVKKDFWQQEDQQQIQASKPDKSINPVAPWFQKRYSNHKNYQILAPLSYCQGINYLIEGSAGEDLHEESHMAKGIANITKIANIKKLKLKSKRNIVGSLRSLYKVLGESNGKKLLGQELWQKEGAFSGWGEIPKEEKVKLAAYKRAINEGSEVATWLKTYKNHPDFTELGPISRMWGIKDIVEGSGGEALHERVPMATGIAYIRNTFGNRENSAKKKLLKALHSLSRVLREGEGKTLLVEELQVKDFWIQPTQLQGQDSSVQAARSGPSAALDHVADLNVDMTKVTKFLGHIADFADGHPISVHACKEIGPLVSDKKSINLLKEEIRKFYGENPPPDYDKCLQVLQTMEKNVNKSGQASSEGYGPSAQPAAAQSSQDFYPSAEKLTTSRTVIPQKAMLRALGPTDDDGVADKANKIIQNCVSLPRDGAVNLFVGVLTNQPPHDINWHIKDRLEKLSDNQRAIFEPAFNEAREVVAKAAAKVQEIAALPIEESNPKFKEALRDTPALEMPYFALAIANIFKGAAPDDTIKAHEDYFKAAVNELEISESLARGEQMDVGDPYALDDVRDFPGSAASSSLAKTTKHGLTDPYFPQAKKPSSRAPSDASVSAFSIGAFSSTMGATGGIGHLELGPNDSASVLWETQDDVRTLKTVRDARDGSELSLEAIGSIGRIVREDSRLAILQKNVAPDEELSRLLETVVARQWLPVWAKIEGDRFHLKFPEPRESWDTTPSTENARNFVPSTIKLTDIRTKEGIDAAKVTPNCDDPLTLIRRLEEGYVPCEIRLAVAVGENSRELLADLDTIELRERPKDRAQGLSRVQPPSSEQFQKSMEAAADMSSRSRSQSPRRVLSR